MAQDIITRCKRWFSTQGKIPGESPEHYLQVATEFLRQSQEITDSLKGLRRFVRRRRVSWRQVRSKHVPLNHRQCAYLVEKLQMAVKSSMEFMSMSPPEQKLESMEIWNLLVRLAMDVKSFVQECCEAEWFQAAKMLIDAFEHVASLGSRLDICIWSFKNRNRTILGTALRRALTNISEDQDRRLRDQVNLLRKVEAALSLESLSNLQVIQRATSILEELEGAVAENPMPDKLDLLVLSSFRDQIELLCRVGAALSSEHISDLEERHLANSLVERFKAAVANPVSDNPQSDFLRVDCESLIREKVLGKGACGEVYRVKWRGIPAAEKTLPEEKEGSLQAVFDQEVTILTRLFHPSIVRLLCYVKEGVKCSIVLELMDKDLNTLIQERMELDEKSWSPRGFPFSTDEAVDIMLQIAEAMGYLHRRRVLHRDLKSQNILVKCQKLGKVEFVYAKVADFGISKTKERSITLSHPTWNTGTARWMAPELIRLTQGGVAGNVDDLERCPFQPFQSDVYSFGMVCYEILTGNVPFASISQPNYVKRKLMLGERPALPSHCPPCLASMVKKCWRAEPKERPTFAEISRELRFMKGSLLIGRDL